jgi:hypothetical protein
MTTRNTTSAATGEVRGRKAGRSRLPPLRSIDSLTINLDTGDTHELSVRKLFIMPDSLDERVREASRAPATLAFIAYYAARARHGYRKKQAKFDSWIAQKRAVAERILLERRGREYLTTDNVSAVLLTGFGEEVAKRREGVEAARFRAEVLELVRDSYRERVWTLRSILSASRGNAAEVE